jgi:Bacteriocin-protection, YdeI or OmpD-Associated/Domain of unknown function (DUF1905)
VAKHRFEAELTTTAGNGTYVVVPLDVPALLGSRRPPVRGTLNGFPFRSTIAAYGDAFYLGVNRELRAAAGVEVGETVVVELERDEEPREVEVPIDLAEALASDGAALATFDGLSYTHRKEYVEWVEEAKREETRRRRVEKAVAMLREGKTQH